MKKLLILRLIIIAALGDVAKTGVFAFKWKSSSLFSNGTVIQACVGDNVTFPWVFEMTSPKQVIIHWSKTSENKPDREKVSDLASYNRDKFYGLSPERDVEFLPNAGIKLPKVTLADNGVYTVEVILFGHRDSYKQVASLQVSDVHVTTSNKWHAFIVPESVYNSRTRLWHVQLGCRPPVIRGQSALPVIWTTPSNRTAISTSYQNYTFILELPLPMEEGDYSCSLDLSVPAVKCLSTLLNTRRAATVNVKRVNTRLLYIEGSVETLRVEKANLNGSLCNISDIVQHLQINDKKCDEEIINLNQTTENNTSLLQNFQTKNDEMTRKIQSKFDNITATVQRNNENIIAMVQRNNDNITAFLQSKFDLITAMVQRNNDSITAMVKSKFDNFAGMIQSKFDNITANVQSKIDGNTSTFQSKFDSITANLQEKIDGITAMVQSKFDNTYAMVHRLQSALNPLIHVDSVQKPASCVDVQKYDNVSGVHTLYLNDNRLLEVYCDQSTDNGGWMVIQRRQDGSVNFYRNWADYEKGFGDLKGEFWIGLANLHQFTKSKTVKLRVDLTDYDGSKKYSLYDTFSISGADDNYRLNVDGYSGTAGDSLKRNNKMQFSTYNRDHDTDGRLNCAKSRRGAWWYADCGFSNLNGRYGISDQSGVMWMSFNNERSAKRAEMKIKE